MRSRSTHQRSFHPRLEALESLALLSVCLVDRLTDKGEGAKLAGDLRYCIEQAQDKDSIQFAVKGTIDLTRALPDLTRSISIEGPGADLLMVRRDSGGDYPIFLVTPNAVVSLSGLTVANGNGHLLCGGMFCFPFGGGIYNEGTLTVSHSTFSGNSAFVGGGIGNLGTLTVSHSTFSGNSALAGGGIGNLGTLTVSHTTFSGNSADDGGGGGIGNRGTLTVSHSTFSGNSAVVGGGIDNAFDGTLTVSHSTFSGNSAGAGGGIAGEGMLTVSHSTFSGNSASGLESWGGGGILVLDGILQLHNTILGGNTAPVGPDLDGTLTTSGYNLISDPRDADGFEDTDLLGVDPLLGKLQDNGGPTLTHALLPGSPALDAGDPTDAPEWDQRGEGFFRIAGKNIDIGAYEEQGGSGPSPGRPPRFEVGVLLADRAPQPVRDVDGGQTVYGVPLAMPFREEEAARPSAPVEVPSVLPERGTSRTELGRFFEDPIQEAPLFVMSTIR